MTFAIVLLSLAVLLACASWFVPHSGRLLLPLAVSTLGCLAVLGALAWWGPGTRDWSAGGHDTVVVLCGLLAVGGGGPVTVAVFTLVDGRRPITDRDSVEGAGQVLRGGAWIGGLERAAVFATVAAGWPEGLAVVLALKGLARYPELRGPLSAPSADVPLVPPSHGIAERFIIGTFVSVLWALACAGVAVA